MRALLIQTPNTPGNLLHLPGKEVPLALCYLAASLREAGFPDVRILDLDFLGGVAPHLERAVADFAPDLVGITSYTHNVGLAAAVAADVKRLRPESVTVLGGFHASALPERTLREFPALDLLVFGEGERTIVDLARALSEGKPAAGIAGIAVREDGGIRLGPPRPFIDPLDDLPFPDRGLVPVTRYVPDPGNYYRLPSTGILFSRGCPFHCAYCSKSVFLHRLRYRRVADFLAEVEDCGDRFGIRDFRLEDEGPTTNPARMRELCEGILARGLAISWHCFSRMDTVDGDLLALMKRAGCYHVTYGLESAIPETLERLGKRLRLDQAERAVALTRALGIECKVNFILGFPWETAADMRRTIRYAMRLAPDLVSFNAFKPLPGSVLFDQMERDGRLLSTHWEDYHVGGGAMPFAAAYAESDRRRLIRRGFLAFHLRPRYVLQRLRRLARHPRREARTIGGGLAILLRDLLGARRAAAAG
jgi:anaerobic magnesium-protoporphyrin IX monomethyl ester cyclase